MSGPLVGWTTLEIYSITAGLYIEPALIGVVEAVASIDWFSCFS